MIKILFVCHGRIYRAEEIILRELIYGEDVV